MKPREPSTAGALLVAAWMLVDAWLIYGAVAWALIRFG